MRTGAGTGRTSRALIISGSVGAGHDGAAHELAARLVSAGVEVTVRDFLDAVPRPVARVLREGYVMAVERVPVRPQAARQCGADGLVVLDDQQVPHGHGR